MDEHFGRYLLNAEGIRFCKIISSVRKTRYITTDTCEMTPGKRQDAEIYLFSFNHCIGANLFWFGSICIENCLTEEVSSLWIETLYILVVESFMWLAKAMIIRKICGLEKYYLYGVALAINSTTWLKYSQNYTNGFIYVLFFMNFY